MPGRRRIERIRQVLECRQDDLAVVIENVWDPHNASAIVRSADGFGAGSVQLLYTQESPPELSRGVSAYTEKWTVLENYDSARALADTVHARGMRLIATQVQAGATSYLAVDWTRPTALVLGNEQRGCSPEILALSDEQVLIPMLGFAQSLNVSVAAAVILAEASRQRLEAGVHGPTWNHRKQLWFDYWLAREVARERRQPAPPPPGPGA